MPPVAEDLTGRQIHAWLVLRRVWPTDAPKKTPSMWLCRCSCGTEKILRGTALRNGETRRCWDCEAGSRKGRPRGQRAPLPPALPIEEASAPAVPAPRALVPFEIKLHLLWEFH